MARAMHKDDLIQDSTDNFKILNDLIDKMGVDSEREFLFDDRDRNVRDVLMHLYEWQAMTRSWHEQGEQGIKPDIPATGYTWTTIGGLNEIIRDKYQETTLAEARVLLLGSHVAMMEFMSLFTNEQLFKRDQFAWTGTSVLGSYFASSVPSHYEWAIKKITKQVRALKKEGK